MLDAVNKNASGTSSASNTSGTSSASNKTSASTTSSRTGAGENATPKLSSFEPVVVHVKRKRATKEDVDAYINELLNRHGHWEHVKRPVRPSDYILVDMVTKINGAKNDKLSGKRMSIDLSPNKMPLGFIEGACGMMPGETKTFTFTASQTSGSQGENTNTQASDTENENTNAQPAGTNQKTAQITSDATNTNTSATPNTDMFDVTLTLHDICIRAVPELTDRFVCEALTDSGSTVKELRENVQKIVQEHLDIEYEKEKEAAADVELSRRLTSPIPDDLIRHAAQELYETLTSNLKAQDITLSEYLESQSMNNRQFQMQLLSQARDSLRQGMALDALFAHLQETGAASIDDTSIERALDEMAPGRKDEARKYFKDNDNWGVVTQMAGRLLAHDYLVRTATFV